MARTPNKQWQREMVRQPRPWLASRPLARPRVTRPPAPLLRLHPHVYMYTCGVASRYYCSRQLKNSPDKKCMISPWQKPPQDLSLFRKE